jgi:hypothetical protein
MEFRRGSRHGVQYIYIFPLFSKSDRLLGAERALWEAKAGENPGKSDKIMANECTRICQGHSRAA